MSPSDAEEQLLCSVPTQRCCTSSPIASSSTPSQTSHYSHHHQHPNHQHHLLDNATTTTTTSSSCCSSTSTAPTSHILRLELMPRRHVKPQSVCVHTVHLVAGHPLDRCCIGYGTSTTTAATTTTTTTTNGSSTTSSGASSVRDTNVTIGLACTQRDKGHITVRHIIPGSSAERLDLSYRCHSFIS